MATFLSIFRGQRNIMTVALIVATLGVFGSMQEVPDIGAALQAAISGLVLFLVLPIMYCRIILKEPLSLIGFGSIRWLPALFWGSVFLGVGGVGLLFVAQDSVFKEAYRLPSVVERSFLWFVAYEVIVVGGIALMYEVFFRGLIMKLWLSPLGVWSVLIQTLMFAGFIALTSGWSWQYASLMFASLFSGVVAYFSGSIYASWLASWTFFFLIDIIILAFR